MGIPPAFVYRILPHKLLPYTYTPRKLVRIRHRKPNRIPYTSRKKLNPNFGIRLLKHPIWPQRHPHVFRTWYTPFLHQRTRQKTCLRPLASNTQHTCIYNSPEVLFPLLRWGHCDHSSIILWTTPHPAATHRRHDNQTCTQEPVDHV